MTNLHAGRVAGALAVAGVVADEPAQFLALSLDTLSRRDGSAGRDGVTRIWLHPGRAEAQPFIALRSPRTIAARPRPSSSVWRGSTDAGFEHRFRFRRWHVSLAVVDRGGPPEALVYAAARDVTDRRDRRTPAPAAAPASILAQAHSQSFLASVSHDLQQPLTVIKGQAQVLQRQLGARRERRGRPARGLPGYMNAAVVRMNGMIQELLDAGGSGVRTGARAVAGAGRPDRADPTDGERTSARFRTTRLRPGRRPQRW